MQKSHPTYLLFFFLLGLFPLMAIAIWSGVRHTSWYVNSISRDVSADLGIPVQIGAVRHPRPMHTRFENVRIFEAGSVTDSETTPPEPLFQIPAIETWNRTSSASGRQIHRMNWKIPEMTLETISLETLWRLHNHVLTWGSNGDFWKDNEFQLLVDGDTVVKTAEPIHVQNAKLRIFYGKYGPQTEIVFSIPDKTVPEGSVPLQLVLQRVQRQKSSFILATLKTGEAGISTRLLVSLFPSMEKMGEKSRFTGKFIVQQSFHGWSGIFNGTFQNISLETALAPHSPLKGECTLELQNARFDGSQLTAASGLLSCLNGSIQRSFLERMLGITQLSLRGDREKLGEVVPFDELAFGFQLQKSQLVLTGKCRQFVTSVFVTQNNEPLVCEPATPRSAISAPLFFEAIRSSQQ